MKLTDRLETMITVLLTLNLGAINSVSAPLVNRKKPKLTALRIETVLQIPSLCMLRYILGY